MPECGGFQILKLYVVFQRMDLLARMRTTLWAEGKDRKIKSESKPPVQGEERVGFARRTSACSYALASQGEPATVFVEFKNKPKEKSEGHLEQDAVSGSAPMSASAPKLS